MVASACAGPPARSPSAAPSLRAPSPSIVASVTPANASPSRRSELPAPDLVGDWTRTQSCQEQLADFRAKGLVDAEGYQWVTANWVPGAPSPQGSDYCAGATAPIPHTHFFTADGQFGSRDENGQQVDDGDYQLVAPGVVTFPSAAHDFGYSGTITVQYVVAGNEATFDVQVPKDCIKDPHCTDAYGWALSAFFAGPPWARS
jgi:hypothetical protein